MSFRKINDEKSCEVKELPKISIELSRFENLKYLDHDENSEIVISATLSSTPMKNEQANLQHLDEGASLKLNFDVNCEDEDEIFSLFTCPVVLTLSTDESLEILGIANIDLYSQCSSQAEKLNTVLIFERAVFRDKTTPLIRKISCNVEITVDPIIWRDPCENTLYFTIESICNLEQNDEENEELSIGFMVPLGSKFTKRVIIKSENIASKRCNQEIVVKRWYNLLHVGGKCSESPFKVKPYEYPINPSEINLLSNLGNVTTINAIGRVVMSRVTTNFFLDHLQNSLEVAIEVMIGDKHLIGFVDPSQLLNGGRKRIRAVVPLLWYNKLLLNKKCNYSSVFEITTSKKARKSKRKSLSSNSLNSLRSGEVREVIETAFVNQCGQPTFIIVELELEKPLLEAVHENSNEMFETDTALTDFVEPNIREIESFQDLKYQLQVIAKNILKIYNNESDINNISSKMIIDGYFHVVEENLVPKMDFIFPTEQANFCDLKNDLLCQLASKTFNSNSIVEKEIELFIAKIYNEIGLKDISKLIYLRKIRENCSEEAYVDYAIHNLRNQMLGKTLACVERALKCNQTSIIGHILKIYISFKLRNFPEAERLTNLMQCKHGDSMEFLMIDHLIKIRRRTSNNSTHGIIPDFIRENIKTPPEIQKIYECREVLWFASSNDEMFLSWQDPFIKSAVLLIKIGCYDFAELALGEYYLKHGANVNHSYLLGVIDALKGDYHNSLIHISKISKQDIGNHQLNYEKITVLMSLVWMELDKYDQADSLMDFHTFTDCIPAEYFVPFLLLGKHYNSSGNYEKAKLYLTHANQLLPVQLSLLELGKCHRNVNKLSSAEQCFRQSINRGYKSEEAWNCLHQIYQKQNRNFLAELCLNNLQIN